MLERLGRYEILERIAAGGQGTVYRAQDTVLDRVVAIKVINQPVADELCDSRGQVSQNLFMFTGLGSKGLTYAPLLAEYLADRLSGQPQCLPARLMRRLASQRLHQAEKSETNSG